LCNILSGGDDLVIINNSSRIISTMKNDQVINNIVINEYNIKAITIICPYSLWIRILLLLSQSDNYFEESNFIQLNYESFCLFYNFINNYNNNYYWKGEFMIFLSSYYEFYYNGIY
jgi:hypothetical protein